MTLSAQYLATRRSLHGAAELLLAGPAYRTAERIRLEVESTGFRTVVMDGPVRRLHVAVTPHGADLVVDPGSDEGGVEGPSAHHHIPLEGTFADVARTAGIDAGVPADLYDDHADLGLEDEIELDAGAVRAIVDWFVAGDAALRELAAAAGNDEKPVLWPEHFDVALSLDEVNYGVSAGDATIAAPYAYVGPWQQRRGDFWNQTFGAARTLDELRAGGTDEELRANLLAFFDEGRRRASESA